MHKASDRLSRGAGGTSGLSFPGLSSIAPVSKICFFPKRGEGSPRIVSEFGEVPGALKYRKYRTCQQDQTFT